MFDTEFDISTLIVAYLQGTITAAERERLDLWLEQDPRNRQHFEQAYEEHTLQQSLRNYGGADRTAVWHKTVSKMGSAAMYFTEPKVKKVYSFRQIAAAAAVLISVLTVSLYLLLQRTDQPVVADQGQYEDDVAPGSHGATLTLANGQQIKLSDLHQGEIAEETGVHITKSADGQLVYELKGIDTDEHAENTLSTSNGETYQVRLPDGSKVWLNAGSSLTYAPSLVSDGRRRVKLVGEAYFEVAKNRSRPFIVQTATQEVEVLGTSFNVNPYADEPITGTTLLEGAVKVRTKNSERMVKPGEQATNNGIQINIAPVDVENVIDWKAGDFYLNQVNFKVAMRKIARWYDIQIIYDDSVPDDMLAGGWIARDRPLSHVLRSIESSGMVKFKIEGRKIRVTRSGS